MKSSNCLGLLQANNTPPSLGQSFSEQQHKHKNIIIQRIRAKRISGFPSFELFATPSCMALMAFNFIHTTLIRLMYESTGSEYLSQLSFKYKQMVKICRHHLLVPTRVKIELFYPQSAV
jgi:hypothetical protein